MATVLSAGARVGASPTTTPLCTVEVRDDLFSTVLPETGAGSQGFHVTSTADGGYLIVADAPGVLANDQTCGAVDISLTPATGCSSGPVTVSGSSDGSFSAALPPGCAGAASVSFEYDLRGDGGTIGTARATIVIDPVTYFRLPDEAPTGVEPTEDHDDAANLPATGGSLTAPVALAACCLLGGLALMAATRTRRQ